MMLLDETPADRLKQARSTRFGTASEAARFLGLATPTYLAHENGTRKLSYEQAEFYAGKFQFRTEWIMSGRGPRSEDPEIEKLVSVNAVSTRNVARPHNANPLLGLLQMVYGPDGSLRAIPGAFEGGAAPLPPFQQTQGYVPEVLQTSLHASDGRRAISLPCQPSDTRFVVNDFFRVRPDSINAEYAYCIRMSDSDIPPMLAPGDCVVIDPSDRQADQPGIYLALADKRLRLILCRPYFDAANTAFVEWWQSPYLPPRQWQGLDPDQSMPLILGRAVQMVAALSSRFVHLLSETVFAAQPGFLERQQAQLGYASVAAVSPSGIQLLPHGPGGAMAPLRVGVPSGVLRIMSK